MLTPDQLHVILEILDKQVAFFIVKTIGQEGLSDQEKKVLRDNGIDILSAYKEGKDLVTLNFHLGMLSNILNEGEVNKLNYNDLVKYIKSGQYIPLNEREKSTIQSIKMQSLADIRANKGRIFQDINNVVNNQFASNRANQEEFIREKIIEGAAQRKSRKEIAKNISRLTGDWARDFNKSVQYISHLALNEGRAAILEKRYGSNGKARGYFQVQESACQYCVKAYLTGDIGSEPKIFTVQELQANGTNIGRKAAEYKPTFNLHVHCRCLFTEYIEGTIWNGSKFVFPKETIRPKIDRPLFRMEFNGKTYMV